MVDLRVYRDNSEIYSWQWEAYYLDGTVLKQYEGSHFKDIDQSKLAEFRMVSILPDVPPVILLWKEGRKLIHFTRVSQLDFGGPNELIYRRYCFGYETKDSKVILTIMPDNGIIVSEDANIRVKVEV